MQRFHFLLPSVFGLGQIWVKNCGKVGICFTQMLRRVCEVSRNTLRTAVTILKRPSGFFRDCPVFIFKKINAYICDLKVVVRPDPLGFYLLYIRN